MLEEPVITVAPAGMRACNWVNADSLVSTSMTVTPRFHKASIFFQAVRGRDSVKCSGTLGTVNSNTCFHRPRLFIETLR